MITSSYELKKAIDNKKIECTNTVVIHVAHTFEYGSWKNYSSSHYKVYKVSDDSFEAESLVHRCEHIKVSCKDIDCGYMKVLLLIPSNDPT